MATVRDVITRALLTANVEGVGQTPKPEDIAYGFTTLNNMLALWSKKRWLIFDLIEVVKTSTGAASYSIGAGADFSVTRPDRIESAFARSGGGSMAVDYSLSIIQSREDYNLIGLKQMQSFPSVLFLDSGYPFGTVYVWPVPSAVYELHLFVKNTIGGYVNLTDTIVLPPEYMEAIDWNLAVRLCIGYGRRVNPAMQSLAKAALETIRGANAQIATLRMPDVLGRNQGRATVFQAV